MGLGGKQGSCLQDTLQVHPCTQSTRYAHGAGPSGLLAEIQLLSMDTGFRRYDKTMKNYGLSKRYSAQPLLNLSSDLNGRGLND